MTMFGSTPSTAPDTEQLLPDYSGYLHVAAAVIEDNAGKVLVARRPDHLHQGGLWEFPGGKVEPDEAVYEALVRELKEEVGIQVNSATPLIRVPHDYADRKVILDIWRVTDFSNVPRGAEGQKVRWVERELLKDLQFPAANLPIVTAARLPHRYLITPEPGSPSDWPAFLTRLDQAICDGIRLVQLRAKNLDDENYHRLAKQVVSLGRRMGCRVLLNAAPEVAKRLKADGVHLTSSRLMALQRRPLDAELWVAASCHNLQELHHAMRIGVDFALVSPVRPTATHPQAKAIGWQGFQLLSEHSTIPLFALGGVGEADIDAAWKHGGQGIAAVRALWPE